MSVHRTSACRTADTTRRSTPATGGAGARSAAALAALAALLALTAAPVAAQSAGNGFLFGAPTGSITLRGGFSAPNAGSDIFRFAANELTLNRSDFQSFTLGGDLAVPLSPRTDAVFGIAYAGSRTPSEFRHWVDLNNLPIQQTTSFTRVPVTASVKTYLLPRGRAIGQFAWIPSRFAPYVGAGAGLMWYEFRQSGDFVDFKNGNSVFTDTFSSSGWTPTAHAFVGGDYSLSPRFAVTTEARYGWARASLGRAFTGFNRIDLSGFAATVGLTIRY